LAKIPTTVITGFLGSGKTTLIRRLLEQADGRRLAVIVNEFGDVGVDAEILRGCGITTCGDDDIVELANGCICCTVADDFLPALTKLMDRPDPPEHILIETSGLALPKPLIKAFTWPQVRTRATVDGVVCVIDADAVLAGRFAQGEAPAGHETPIAELFDDQLACADMVVLSKTDLIDEAGLETVKALVRDKARPGVPMIAVRHGDLEPSLLLGLSAAAEDDLAMRQTGHDLDGEHGHEDFESFVVTGNGLAGVETLTAGLTEVLQTYDILRLKGVVAVSGSAARLIVQAMGPRLQTYFDRPWQGHEVQTSSLVVIGQAGLDKDAITAAIKAALA
jgi:cobalamin biosynthesis protein CobW